MWTAGPDASNAANKSGTTNAAVAGGPAGISISAPQNFAHTVHVGFDPGTGEFTVHPLLHFYYIPSVIYRFSFVLDSALLTNHSILLKSFYFFKFVESSKFAFKNYHIA